MSERRLLREEIASEFGELGKLEVGSDKYKITVDGVTKLLDRAIEMDKLEAESQQRASDLASEYDWKEQQMNEDRKDRIVKNVITAAGILIPVGVTIWGTIKSIEFEKEGTITTLIGRGFINKLLPKK